MIVADVLGWFLFILGLMLVFVSHWVATEALFAPFVQRARAQYRRPVRLTLLGLALVAPALVVAFALLSKNNPAVKLLGGFFLAVPIFIGLAGSTGLSQKVGLGLPSPRDDAQPWRRVLRGGMVLVLTFLLPVLGWFVLLPWTLVSGCAAAVLSFKAGPADALPASASAPAAAAATPTPPPLLATAKEMAG